MFVIINQIDVYHVKQDTIMISQMVNVWKNVYQESMNQKDYAKFAQTRIA